MPEYTYEDIITAKDIITGKVKKEDIIGKKGWGVDKLDQLSEVIKDKTCELNTIAESTIYPFLSGLCWYIYFLPEKVEKLEYEPFDFDDPEDRKELMGKTIINNYGLDGDGEFREVMIVGFMNKSDEDSDCWSSNGDTEGTIAMTVEGYFHADELLKECTFLDGTPCGKLKEDK